MTSVLIDTSVWVDHFRHRNAALVELIEWDRALTHPMVIGELACGTPPGPRVRTLSDIGLLRQAQQISVEEVMAFIEREALYGLGCGLVDLMLLGSVLMTPGAQIWTLDKRLMDISARFGVAYRPRVH
ncbi:twitching motility protein PilT [Burkholderia sp. THE68]|uniref:type II toxin-antitoxin system VapC family toxin n=1 Tax=Burkholderiaceae TaxID=119060 RepID=UPI001317C95C|nr:MULTISPECIES: PIN domain-containing protein [Burkholderiaceae]BBU31039.1 twitching motility protein PilT [Burkholderia sp. THE68]BCQ26128.1 VapC toxin family PIN domain ribonuclease [Caballeronia sp. NK8]